MFRCWDSGDLADRIEQLFDDEVLYQRLASAAPRVADYYSVARLADRMLAHLGLAAATDEAIPSESSDASERAKILSIDSARRTAKRAAA